MSRHLSCLTIAGIVAVFALTTGSASAQARHPIVQTGILCEKVGGAGGGGGTANYGVGGLVTNTTAGQSLTVTCPVVQSARTNPAATATVWVLDRSFGANVTCTLTVYQPNGFVPVATINRSSAGFNPSCQQLNFGAFFAPQNSRIVLTCTIPGPTPAPFGGSSGVCTYGTT